MWGGRFAGGPSEIMAAINASLGFDRRLYAQDIRGSHAHLDMLEAAGIVSAPDAAAIRGGLDRVEQEIATGRFVFKPNYMPKKYAVIIVPISGLLVCLAAFASIIEDSLRLKAGSFKQAKDLDHQTEEDQR